MEPCRLHAAAGGSVDVLRMLLEHGEDAKCLQDEGCTPLHMAVMQFLGPTEDLLPGCMATPGRPSHSMEEACAHALDICTMLIQHGADVDAMCLAGEQEECTPLYLACVLLQLPLVHALLACGAVRPSCSNCAQLLEGRIIRHR